VCTTLGKVIHYENGFFISIMEMVTLKETPTRS